MVAQRRGCVPRPERSTGVEDCASHASSPQTEQTVPEETVKCDFVSQFLHISSRFSIQRNILDVAQSMFMKMHGTDYTAPITQLPA